MKARAILWLALPVAIGCDGSPASVRLIHASTDAPALDVYIKGGSNTTPVVFSALPYAGVSAYQPVKNEGDYVFELREAGAAASAAPLATSSSTHLSPGEIVTAVVAGLADTSDDTAALQVLVEPERFNLPADDNVWVQFVNAVPDVPACDLAVNGTVDTGMLARFATVEGLVSPSAPAAVKLSATAGSATVATSFTAPLPTPKASFAIALGISSLDPGDDRGLSLLIAGTDGTTTLVRQDPLVYAVHAIPDAAALDVYNGTTEAAAALGFGSVSGAIQLPPGDQTLDLFAHSPANARPGSDPLGSVSLGGLEAGHVYLAVASGYAGTGRSPALASASYVSAFASSPNAALLRVVQASPDLPKVTLGAADMTFTPFPDFTNLGFLDASPPAGTPTGGSSVLGVQPAGSAKPTDTFPITLSAGQTAFAVLAGSANGPATDQPLQLIQVLASGGFVGTAIPAVAVP